MEQWWNDTDREKSEVVERCVLQCHFVHHRYNNDWLGTESGPTRLVADGEPAGSLQM